MQLREVRGDRFDPLFLLGRIDDADRHCGLVGLRPGLLGGGPRRGITALTALREEHDRQRGGDEHADDRELEGWFHRLISPSDFMTSSDVWSSLAIASSSALTSPPNLSAAWLSSARMWTTFVGKPPSTATRCMRLASIRSFAPRSSPIVRSSSSRA